MVFSCSMTSEHCSYTWVLNQIRKWVCVGESSSVFGFFKKFYKIREIGLKISEMFWGNNYKLLFTFDEMLPTD